MKIQSLPIEKILPYEKNAKKHPPEQVAKIVQSIKTSKGFDQPIVVDKDHVIIKGHGRRLAAIEMGLTHVPVLVRDDLTEEEVRAARLADNRAAVSDIDTAILRIEMEDLNMDLLKGIFDDKELVFTTTDLGQMDSSAFIEDLGAAVDEQEKQTEKKLEELKDKEVALVKALGFKSIPGADEIYYSRFLSQIEQQTGLKGRDALTTFVKALVGEVNQP